MKWFEPIIIIVAVLLVVIPIITYFYKKKKGTLKCECGHEISKCPGNCGNCNQEKITKKKLVYLVSVDGMKCGMCESHINDVIRENYDIIKVKSSRKNSSTTIICDHLLNVNQIKESITNLGYVVNSVRLL